MSEESKKENYETVNSIRGDVISCVRGELFRDENGNETTRPSDADEDWDLNHEQISLSDYFEDCLGIEYTVTGTRSDPEIRGAKFMIACGGPNIYVCQDRVRLYWWGDYAESCSFPDDVEDAILEYANECFGNY